MEADVKNGSSNTNGNGTWKNYILTIISGLILTAIVGSIIFERDTAALLGKYGERLTYLERRIDERTLSRFSREDANKELGRLELRIERLEKQRK